MQSTGWTFRAQSAVAAGTTSLTITKPSGTVDGDIMFMWLTHKGAAYATMPAGWTLVAQNISGSTRGELHWKRASGEGANYSITGLADTALGMIASYIGGLAAGNVVNVANSIANAAGVYSTPQITPTLPNTLILCSTHAGGNVSIGTQGTGSSQGQGNFFANFGEWDEQLLSMRTLSDTGTTNGTDCRQCVSDATKPIPDITGTLGVTNAFNRENVRIVAAMLPETAQLSAGTRYYFGSNVPTYTRYNEEAAGDWDSEAYGPGINGAPLTHRLVQLKTLAGELADGSWVTNRQGNYDELIARYVTPPLEAQAISGTIDISLMVRAMWLSSGGLTNDTVARYKLHVYTTVGQTGVVRDVLLNNYVDSVDFPKFTTGGSAQIWRGLASPQALTPANTLDGDTICVELGVRIVSSPTPAPTYPPTEYSRIPMTGFGGTQTAGTCNQVGAIDSVQGTTTASRAGWIDFSSTITEKAAPAAPANDSYAGRITIPATLPQQTTPLAVGGALSNAWTVWYEWTPDQSGNVGIYTNGSNYGTIMAVLTGTPGAFVAVDDYQQPGFTNQRGLTVCSFDAVMGTTYLIGIYVRSSQPPGAGELWLTLTWRDVVAQEGDLYIPNREIYAYRDGLPINWGALGFLPTGCAIDYSRLPMFDIEDGSTNTTDRIFINVFTDGLLEVLDLPTFSRNRTEIDFFTDAFQLGGNDPNNGAAIAINPATNLVTLGNWGDGFLDVNDSGTTGSVAAFFDSVSSDPTFSAVYRCSILDGDNQTPPPVAAERFEGLTVDSTTAWYPAISEDGAVMYYTSDGFYIPPRVTPAAFKIRAYNLDTATQLPDVATLTCTGPQAASGPHGLCLHSDGTLFVCTGSTVQRVDIASGAVLQSYTATGDFGYDGQDLWDVHIHPDGQSIIAIDGQSMTVFEWDIESGTQTNYFQTWLSQGNFTQFAIYQPNPLPPPGCPGERSGTFIDGAPYTEYPTAPCGGTGTRSGSVTDGVPYTPVTPTACVGTGTRDYVPITGQ